jgi:formylmethanofuran dehydrogenase subunit E
MSKCTRCEEELEEDTGIRLLDWILCEICYGDI